MTEQPRDTTGDDTEGHAKFFRSADVEQSEGDTDTEGHWRHSADAEQAEGDDTEGHGGKHR